MLRNELLSEKKLDTFFLKDNVAKNDIMFVKIYKN